MAALAAAAAALVAPSAAAARGGSYDIVGATPEQRAQIVAALDASAFPWGVVPQRIRIVVGRGLATESVPGTIVLDANLVDTGSFAWGPIQHEYAHQVDFFLLDDGARARLAARLGGTTWGAGVTLAEGVAHADQTGERFADELAWSFWPSRDNVIEPAVAMPARAFRALLGGLLRRAP